MKAMQSGGARPGLAHAVFAASLAFSAGACGSNDSPPAIAATVCPAGLLACGLECKDVLVDPANCGGCGIPCATGELCQAGVCECVSGMVCNGACVAPDANHCGGCAIACQAGQVCSGGACAAACGSSETLCGASCVVTATDAFNCGGCGVACAPGLLCSGGACVAGAGTVPDGGVGPAAPASTLVTSTAGAYWATDGVLTEVAGGKADITVNDTATAQTWEGFGGAFNEMGWSYLSLLSPADRDAAIHLLYGADGARFTFGRIPIGASDYAMDRYTLDETPGDVTMSGFSIERDKERLIPFVKAAQAVKPNIRLWASPWTPPTWMKDAPFSSGNVPSAFDGGMVKNDDVTLGAFAQYFVKFVQAYGQLGMPIEAISPQNEPGYRGNYPTCGWQPSTYARFVGQFLGPAVASAGLSTKIILGTFNGGEGDTSIVSTVMGDAVARGYIRAMGFQWGMLDKVRGVKAYGVPVWQTEHKCGNYPWMSGFVATAAPNDHAYAVESWGYLRDWINAGVTAYSAWNMVLDTVGVGIDTTRVWPQDALLTVDTSSGTLHITPTYWVFRHFSQFVATGAKVVAVSGGDAVAFRNPDGSIVVVLFNKGSAKTVTVAVAGKTLQLAVPGNGWATVVTR
jgi:glucosylceramidase